MKSLQYKDFSRLTHAGGQSAKSPTCCQFELTFSCNLHCRHCYTDCYNNSAFKKKELNTIEVKRIVDKIRRQGVVWLCFTGGDPLFREDFPEIYAYAKSKGFLVTVFTSGYSLSRETLDIFKKQPPFVVEMTLNAVTEKLFEHISQVKGSFQKVKRTMDVLLKAKIPLKIKTMVTRDNFSHINRVQEFLAGQGITFRPDYHLLSRLNKDNAVCALRVSPSKILSLMKINNAYRLDCGLSPFRGSGKNKLFHCTVGVGDEFRIDPCGNLFLCPGIRTSAINVLHRPLGAAFRNQLSVIRNSRFVSDSECSICGIRESCLHCPGRAYLETGDPEAASPYYCALTKGMIKK